MRSLIIVSEGGLEASPLICMVDNRIAMEAWIGFGRETSRNNQNAHRAAAIWPALKCGHRPNDGRQTTRLTAKIEELQDYPIIGYRDLWQRSDRRAGL